MSTRGCAALRVAVAVVLGASAWRTAAATEALTNELARCAAIASADSRLACYDTVAGRTGHGAATPIERKAATDSATIPMRAPATVAAPPPDPATAAKNFGLSNKQLHAPPQGPQSIQARVAKIIIDPVRRNYVELDNGQTWASLDGELQLNKGELVTISRAALGSFMLASNASKLSYHVSRVR